MGDAGLVQAVLRDYRASALPDPEKVLLAFIEKVNRRSHEIGREDLEALKRAHWSDEAVYDAITVCALFNFYNRWCDAAGVHALPAEEYKKSGKRLAQHGYVMG